MKYSSKIDANQPAIVKALRGVGASVQSLAAVGKGAPDLLIGFRGVVYVAEVKDPAKPPSHRKLTPLQSEWHAKWQGPRVPIVETADDALRLIGALPPAPTTSVAGPTFKFRCEPIGLPARA